MVASVPNKFFCSELFSISQEAALFRGYILYFGCKCKCTLFERLRSWFVLTLGRARQFIPPPCMAQGGRLDEHLPRVFNICSISKQFWLQWKAFDLLNKMRYILWVVALLEACDVTNNGRHLGFYQELEIRLKPREMVIFCALHEK